MTAPFPEENQPINLTDDLVDLAHYRKDDDRTCHGGMPDPIFIHLVYAHDNYVYDAIESGDPHRREWRIKKIDADEQKNHPASSNERVNKFAKIYSSDAKLLVHKRLADVLIDTAIDLRDHQGLFTVVMDGLRTFEAADKMASNRRDLVDSGLLSRPGKSAHNRALAVDSKLCRPINPGLFPTKLEDLKEADEHGHLDDLNLAPSHRFYQGDDMTDEAKNNRLLRLQAWQRASVKNHLPIANLLEEFWDDRLPGSPADFWRVLSCRALCIGKEGDPKKNPIIRELKSKLASLHRDEQQQILTRQQFAENAHRLFTEAWNQFFSPEDKARLESLLNPGQTLPPGAAGDPPPLKDFIFHEWLQTIHDKMLEKQGIVEKSEHAPHRLSYGYNFQI